MPRASRLAFAFATLAPLALLAAALTLGGAFGALALLWMTLFVVLADQAIPHVMAPGPGTSAPSDAAEFPGGTGLLVAIAAGCLALLPLAVSTTAQAPGVGFDRIAALFAAGLWIGQVAVPAAHELIHRTARPLFRLGAAVFVAILFGHHASAHRLVHHRHAASPLDPNSARAGEGFYAFAWRAWRGSYAAGRAAETALGRGGPHPYHLHAAGSLACLALAWGLGGWTGVAVWTMLGVHAQVQLLLADYVQHYGLVRHRSPDGRLEPMGPSHSWNAPHWASTHLMLNAPRHSDHHAHPARPYTALRLPEPAAAPRLPWPPPLACAVALVPPLWNRTIAPHLAPWR